MILNVRGKISKSQELRILKIIALLMNTIANSAFINKSL